MNKREANPKQSNWTGDRLASARWQELHAHLSRCPETAEYGWAGRSSLICKWRAAPAVVSQAMTPAAG
jgi:hypothetical protein